MDGSQEDQQGEPVTRSGREPSGPYHLLFVCSGNTCRSPMALGLARSALESWGWRTIEVRSAGVAAFSGTPASQGALRASSRHGIDLTGYRSTELTPDLVAWADWILTMSRGHLVAVERMGGAGKSSVITDLGADPHTHGGSWNEGVVDPIGGDDSVYEETFQQLRTLVERRLVDLVADKPE